MAAASARIGSDAAPARTYSRWCDRVGNSTKLFSSAAPAQISRQVGFQASLAQLLSLGFLPTASRVISKHSRPVSHVSQPRLNQDYVLETMAANERLRVLSGARG